MRSVKLEKLHKVLTGLFVGALIVCGLSVIQKITVGFNPLLPKSYIIPFIFGGFSGAIIGYYYFKVKLLNDQLSKSNDKLESFLPICSNCKNIRKPEGNPNDNGSWEKIESYIEARTSSRFSHTVCPDCTKKLYGIDYSI